MEYELNKIILENLEKKYKNDLSVHSIDYYSDESKIRKIRFLPHFEFNDTIVPVKNLTVSFNVQNTEKIKKMLSELDENNLDASEELFELINIKMYRINYILYIENENTCDYYDISHTDYQNFIKYLKTSIALYC